MNGLYKECELGAVCARLSSGKGISAKNIFKNGKYPVFGGNGQRGFTNCMNFDGRCAIIGRQGAFCGNVRYFSGQAYMTEHAIVLCANCENCTEYLYYLLSTMELGRLSGQSAQPGLSVKVLAKQRIFLPDLTVQKKVAHVLRTIDEKIESNTQVNHNLEQQAQVLFERLLCSGNGETTLDSIALINPPRSLKKGCLARCIDMAQLSTSQSFPQLGTIKPYSGGMKFKNGDTIFARITPCLENGKTAYIDFLKEDEVAFGSTEYIVMSSRGGMPSPFFYCLARYKDFIEYATKRMNGSSGRQRVSADAIAAFPIPFFSGDAMCEFGKTALPVFNVIKNNSIENLRLAALRDTLLPRLMSGEIDVSEVEV